MEPLQILLINQSYVPDRGATGQLLGDLFPRLAARGAEVTVVAAPPTYTDELIKWSRFESHPGIQIRRVGPARFKGRKSLLNRIASYVGFLWAAFWGVGKLMRKQRFDLIMTASNPPFVGLIGAWYGSRQRIPFVYVLHDLHPDILLRSRQASIPLAVCKLWDRMNRYIFRTASRIVVLGPQMKTYLASEKGVDPGKVQVIHNWAHPELEPAARTNEIRWMVQADEDTLLVVYSGNMGVSHNLDWLLQAADRLREYPIQFLFVGHGAKKRELELQATQQGLSNVHFLPFQPARMFPMVMAAADLAVVALEPGLEGLAVPSKTYAALASGRPILAIMRRTADTARIVENYECGWVAESPEQVVGALYECLREREELDSRGLNARQAYIRYFSLARAVDEYWQMIMSVAQSPVGTELHSMEFTDMGVYDNLPNKEKVTTR